MNFRNLLPSHHDDCIIDPIQQIITPSREIKEYLHIDTHRIGARRIMDFEEKQLIETEYLSVSDHYHCVWQMKKVGDYTTTSKSTSA